ncbi:MAG: ParB/RepB/Spo0J family partition protein [Pirellulales bacterium]
MKSTGGSKGSRASAGSAADKAFLRDAASPYEATASTGPELGRSRLKGAFLIPIDRIRPDPAQVRKSFNPQSLEEFAQSIREVGILQPIAVRYDEKSETYVIISGERRYRAALLAKLSEIPCLVREPGQDRVLLHQISENWQRENVDPIELGRALAGLQEAYQYTLEDLVRLTGKGKGEISKHLAIAGRVDPVVQAAAQLAPKSLTKRHLYSLSQLKPEDQREVAAEVKRRRLTAQQTEELAESKRLKSVGVTRHQPPALTRRFNTHHGMVLVKTKRGQSSDDHVIAALKEAKRQVLDTRKE